MSAEKFTKYYVEILTSTLNDQVLRSVSLQANARVLEETLQELSDKNTELTQQLEKLNSEKLLVQTEKDKVNTDEINRLRTTVSSQQSNINTLQNENAKFRQQSVEFEKTKHQLDHLATFRSQLIQTQQELQNKDILIAELNDKITLLQATPTRKKKVKQEPTNDSEPVEQPVEETVEQPSENPLESLIKDGGSF
jgi:cell division protein FtsB